VVTIMTRLARLWRNIKRIFVDPHSNEREW
jgi:hypothetical protein